MHPFHEIFQVCEKKKNFTQKYVKQVIKYKILPSICLETNGGIPGTCLASIFFAKKSHFSEFQTLFAQTYTNKINSLSILKVRRTL